jgi:16S rRNA G966 N2-methylase RsmD
MNLVKWDAIRTAIESSKDIEELTAIKDQLRAYQILAEQSKQSADVQSKIAIYKARADRKCGEWLKDNVKQGGDRKTESKSSMSTLKDLGVTKDESSRLQKIASIPEDKFEGILAEAERETTKINNNMLVNIAKEAEKTTRREEEKSARGKAISDIEIRKGDFKKVLADVYDIDAIITDPPYPKEHIECFSDLGKFAKEHLKEDGFVVVYSGQYHLLDVTDRLREHLTYVWAFCLYHVGKKQLVNGVNIMCGWKPVLIFSNGRKKMRYPAYDVLISEKMEKHSHEWQQSESGVVSLVDIFSKPGDLVVDPFAGAGTFLKVANELGRKTIGAEIEEQENEQMNVEKKYDQKYSSVRAEILP